MFSSRKTTAPASGASPATLSKSLRIRSSASAYLNRTPSSTTNRTTWTWSGWVKRGSIGGSQVLFGAGPDGSNYTIFYFSGTVVESLEIYNYTAGSTTGYVYTSSIFKDPSAWYHIVLAVDTTQATSANRIKIYVNNVLQPMTISTAFGSSLNTFVNANNSHRLGCTPTTSTFYDGYMTDVYLIDGQQLTPSSFGTTNATTGQWSPATYTGTYGTNGFHLTFANTTSTTTIGYDTSGNSNNWTTNNISLTAGATYDSMNDVPVAYSASAGNWCVINPNAPTTYSNFANGNLQVNWTSHGSANLAATTGTMQIPNGGKFYFESSITYDGNNGFQIGVCSIQDISSGGDTLPNTFRAYRSVANAGSYGYQNSGSVTNNNSNASSGSILGVAVDLVNGKFWVAINNTWQGGGSPSAGTSPGFSDLISSGVSWIPYVGGWNWTGTSTVANVNFGQQPFTYTPPTGFVGLNTYNLPTPAIAQGNKYMDATLYTGTLTTQSITNAGAFKPDLVWIKSRSAATDHKLTDSVRGATKALISDTTGAETTDTLGLTSFNSGGFTVSTDTNYNNLSATYVGWQWQAGAGTSGSNTNGTITSTVSVSTTAGFSVVTYTGNGTQGATVGHGIGSTPYMIIISNRTSGGNHVVYHVSLTTGYFLRLNTTDAQVSATSVYPNAPSSSTFTIGNDSSVNSTSTNYVAYCFAPVAGFSAFGSYTGNGSADGPFVYCGFRPKFILYKNLAIAEWIMLDSSRNTTNVVDLYLFANSSGAEATFTLMNFLSNGFKLITSNGTSNGSGNTIIYMAFAENPFQYANAR